MLQWPAFEPVGTAFDNVSGATQENDDFMDLGERIDGQARDLAKAKGADRNDGGEAEQSGDVAGCDGCEVRPKEGGSGIVVLSSKAGVSFLMRGIRQGEMQRCCGQNAQEKEVIFERELWDELLPNIQRFRSTGYTFVGEESVVVHYS